jgi:alpha-beta hydrolase superfamily lysophospholipase
MDRQSAFTVSPLIDTEVNYMTSASKLTVKETTWESKDHTSFYVAEWRPAEARAAVLLVHGLGEHCRRYDHVAEIFNAAGIAMLGFDMRGHGRTSGKRGHIPSMEHSMGDIDHFLGEVKTRFAGLPQFTYGHSMGGMQVLNHAITRSPDVSGVISTSPGLEPGTPVAPIKLFLANLLYSIVPEMTLDNGLDITNLAHDPAVAKAYHNDPLTTPLVSARLGLDLINTGRWVKEHGEDFNLPLLLMHGTGDHIASLEATRKFASRVPRNLITYKEWEGLYHETHNEAQRAEVIGTMVNWIQTRL